MEIKTVALLGAGGIGAYLIWGLTDLLGENFCVVAEGDRAKRLKRDGLQINDRHFSLSVKTPQEAAGCDLLLIAVKHYSLNDALPAIQTIVGPQTIVISLLNGIDSEEMIAQAIGSQHLLHSMIRFSAQHRGAAVSFDPKVAEGLFFGKKDVAEETEQVLAVKRLFEQTPIRHHAVSDIVTMQWKKFLLNISGNLPQAVLGVGYGAYFDSEHVALIRETLSREVSLVAAALGINLEIPDPKKAVFAKPTRFSTLQDLDEKRHTEIDMFLGVLIEKAHALGLSVPFSEYTYHAIKALEEKNDGKFDYTN